MSKGENIFKRKDGRWEARYVKGREFSGKIRYGFCYGKTYKEAKEKVTAAKAGLVAGKPCAREKRRLDFFCDEWLRNSRSGFSAATSVKYEGIIEKHIKPRLGKCFPASLDTALVDEFADDLLSVKMLAPKTVRDILVLLRTILAYTARLLPDMPLPVNIRYPKERRKEARVLTADEQTRFVRYLLTDMDNCKFGVLLALLTGMRIGELCALRWKDISLQDSTVKISFTMQRLKNTDKNAAAKTKIVIGSPKSEASNRIIPMSDSAARLCKQMPRMNPSAFVLTGSADHMEPRALQYRMKRYTADCGLENVHFHTLRHTFATRCAEAGFELKSLSEILGHANTSVTLSLYVHPSMELKRINMNKLVVAGL